MRMIAKSMIAGALVSLATVAVSGAAYALPCVNNALSSYTVSGFSCQIDDKNFSNFVYTPDGIQDGGTLPAAGAIAVNPSGFGFNFVGLWNAPNTGVGGGPSSADSTLSYRVATISGAPIITDATLFASGSATGTGTFSVQEQLCAGGLLSSCPAGGSHLLAVSNTSPGMALVNFTGVNLVDVTKDILVTGSATGTGQISNVMNAVSQTTVPEPASLAILGVSLLGMGAAAAARRRRFRK